MAPKSPEALFNFLLGQVMKATGGKANPQLARHILATRLIEILEAAPDEDERER